MYEETTWQETLKHAESGLQAPCYIFDADILARGVQQMHELMPHCGALCYAMKANPFLVKYIDPYVDRFEVCSPGEYEICSRAGIDPEKIIVSGVSKTEHSMRRIFELGRGKGIFTAESMQHYKILSRLAAEKKTHIKMLVRLTSGNQFGVDEATLEEIFRLNQGSEYCQIIGIHYFSGTQKKLKKIEKELAYVDAYAKKLKDQFHMEELQLEYGPGLSVAYFEGDKPAPRKEQMEALEELLKGLENFSFVGIEMGRFVASDCGCFITQIDDVKKSDDTNFIILDSGLHQINYFGQMMGMKLPPIHQFPKRDAQAQEYTLCGALCTTNDILVRDIALNAPEIGDKLFFQRCGAYSMTEGISLFLSRDIPAVYVYSQKAGYECLRESFATDLLNSKQSEQGAK